MKKNCCSPEVCHPNKKQKGFFQGLFYGLVPHTFCILFIIFSILGVAAGTALAKNFLLIPNLLPILIFLSFFFAIISAVFYLKKGDALNLSGIKNNRKYLAVLFGTTISVNIILFYFLFPLAISASQKTAKNSYSKPPGIINQESVATLRVDIPCSGHAALISDELKKLPGVAGVKFSPPNLFAVNYDPKLIAAEGLLDLEVFRTYKAEMQ